METLKANVNKLMNMSGSERYVATSTLSCMHDYELHGNRKYRLEDSDQMLTGQVPDISPLLSTSSEPVYYKDSNQVSSESTEALGYWVGMAPNVGHAMTYKILTDTRKIIVRSCIRILLRSKQRTYVSITTGKGYSVRLISKRRGYGKRELLRV
jgi:hypothetical protein